MGLGNEELLIISNRAVSVKVSLVIEDGYGSGLPGLWGATQQRSESVQGGCATRRTWSWRQVRSLASLMTWKAALTWLRTTGPRAALRPMSES